jgi:SAM-dependent methyltransferase
MSGLEDWLSVARSSDPDDLRERILTGYKEGKPFTPYVPTVELPPSINRVLDFGCGLGRNFPYLRKVAGHVTGFDLPPMIERCRALAGERVDLLCADWTEIRRYRFDLIFASLVLQHIEPEACQSYLKDFARLAPRLYVLTRVETDFGPNMFDLVAESGVFHAEACVRVEHDPRTHQLQVLGGEEFENVRRRSDGHYEVLLRSLAVSTA